MKRFDFAGTGPPNRNRLKSGFDPSPSFNSDALAHHFVIMGQSILKDSHGLDQNSLRLTLPGLTSYVTILLDSLNMSGRYTQISRLFRVLRLLDEAPEGLTVTEIHAKISEHYKVDKRSVYRDLEALDASGFPVFEEALGEDGRSMRWKISRKLKFDRAVFSEKEPVEVVLKFSKEIVPIIQKQLFHPSQKSTINDDGSLTLKLRITLSSDVIAWVLSFGPKVKVFEPSALRREVAALAKQVSELYQGDFS